ncbi:MAG: glycosyltransferase family 4 protein [Flavobacteriaceae bacterium]|nr:glycosyltransferase family 4 protein [Flavobacteriaceae bacterium]
MKIGFDAKRMFHNSRGLGNYSRDLVAIMSDYFSENKYFLYNPKKGKIERYKLRENNIEIMPKGFFWKKLSSIWRQIGIAKQVKEDGIDIFHGLSNEIPKNIKQAKVIVTIHDLIFLRFPHLYKKTDVYIQKKKAEYAISNSDKIIAISEQTKQDLIEYLGAEPSKIEVIYQGCHKVFKTIIEETKRLNYLKENNIPTEFILNVGAIEPRKNVLSLVKAIRNMDTHLVIVGGKTPYTNEVINYIESNNMQDRIHILEGVSIENLAILYQSATLFVYPSIFEGFGIPIIEALYSKTPVITSLGSCFSEAGGPKSIYLEPYDVDTLENEIKLLLSDLKKRNEMAEQGYVFVQKFNDDIIAKNMNKLYTKVLG